MQSLCIVQYDDRFESDEGKNKLGMQYTLANANREMCEDSDNCTYIRRNNTNQLSESVRERPEYWQKVAHVQNVLQDDTYGCDYVMWMDTDAVLTERPSVVLDKLIANADTADFIAAPDNQVMDEWTQKSPFNAGVFVVKNTESGQNLMQEWQDHWDKVQDLWTEDNGNWSTETQWGGEAYEQGAFAAHFSSKPNVASVHWCNLQRNGKAAESDVCVGIPTLTAHFAADTKDNILDVLDFSNKTVGFAA